MAAGLVTHTITTSTGVSFTVNSWVPNTAAPDVGAIPVHVAVNSSGTPETMGAGAVDAATKRITLASDDPAVALLTAMAASESVLDDWDESDRAKVNLIVGQAGVAAGAGSVSATTPRVTLASDDPAVAILGAAADAASTTTTIKAALRGIATALGITAFDLGVGTGGTRTLRVSPDLTRAAGATDSTTLRIALASDSPGVVANGQTTKSASVPVTLASDQEPGFFVTCSTDVTRPSDTTAYAANDCISDSTSAPTSGGFTLTGAGRISGGSGIITDVLAISSADPATLLQAELWIFDSAGTNVNDNSAFALSDSDAKKLVGKVPLNFESTVAGSGTNSIAQVQGLNLGYTCVGTANLRFLLKAKNAYTPISGEVFTIRAKCLQTN